MAELQQHERTEPATPRRREEAREQGQVAVSADLATALLLIVGGMLLWWGGRTLGDGLLRLVQVELQRAYRPAFDTQHAVLLMQWSAGEWLRLMLPLLLITSAIVILINGAQVGLHVSFEPIRPDLAKLSWIRGWERLFSTRSAVRGSMLLLKLAAGIAITIWFMTHYREWLTSIAQGSLTSAIRDTWTAALLLTLTIGGALLLMGSIDYLYQRWQLEQNLRMSRQEVREEHKRMEGDPHVKQRLRRMQREMLKLKMLRKVPTSSVVLTNPTHIAVALYYDRSTMKAPRVVAKGKGPLAKRIARIAREHGVPVLERKPLARALYASVGVDQDIPPNLYRAIAEILAHIYKLRRAGQSA